MSRDIRIPRRLSGGCTHAALFCLAFSLPLPSDANTWSPGPVTVVTDPAPIVSGSGGDTSGSGSNVSVASGSTIGNASKQRGCKRTYTYNGSYPHADSVYVNATGRIRGNVGATQSGNANANSGISFDAFASYDTMGYSPTCGLNGTTTVNGAQNPPNRSFDKTLAVPGGSSLPIEHVWKRVMGNVLTVDFTWTLNAGGSVGIYNGGTGPYTGSSTSSAICETTNSL